EIRTLRKDILPSHMQQVHNVYRRRLMKRFLGCGLQEINHQEKMKMRRNLFEQYRSLLIDEINNDEYISYASLDKPVSALQHFMDFVKNYSEKYVNILTQEDAIILQQIYGRAEFYLAGSLEEASEELLNATAQKEQEVYK